MIPMPLLLVQLVLAVGGALFVGNLAVVVRHRFARDKDALPPPPPTRRLAFNLVVGGLVTLWAMATLVVRFWPLAAVPHPSDVVIVTLC